MVIANSGFDWLGTHFHTQYRAYTAHRFFDQIASYKYKFFQETQIGTITSKISDAFNVIPVLIFMAIKIFINFILYVIAGIIILSSVNKLFVFAMLIWIVIFISLIIIFYNKYEPLNKSYAQVRPKIYGFLSDYFSNILTVRLFGNQSIEKSNLNKLTNEFINKGVKCGIFLRNYYAVHGVIVAAYMGIILTLLGYLSTIRQISAGDFALVFMVNYKIIDLLFEISNNSRDFIINCGIVANAIQLLEYDEMIKYSGGASKAEIKQGKIVFNKGNVESWFKQKRIENNKE